MLFNLVGEPPVGEQQRGDYSEGVDDGESEEDRREDARVQVGDLLLHGIRGLPHGLRGERRKRGRQSGGHPRTDTGSVTATLSLVRQIGSTTATAIVGGLIGAGVAAGLPAGLATLTPQAVRAAPDAVQLQVADLYSSVLSPIFLGLAIVYALGVVAALLLPDGRLSDEFEQHTRDAAEATTA